MGLRLQKIFFLFIAALQFSCSQNIFSELASKNSDEALLVDARTAVNKQDYQSAIDIITTRMSTFGQAQPETKEVLASGYAGRCGLNFINFVTALSAATSGSAFTLVSTPFVAMAVDPVSCYTSITVLESIGATESRTSSQNAFASVVGMSLMGSAVRLYTDDMPVNGDGVQDANNISCTLTDAQVDNIVLGFGFMSKNFSYLSTSQLGSTSQSTLDSIITTCTSVAGSSCTITDPSLVTPQIRDTIKDLMNTVEYGIGTFVTGGNTLLIPGACP